MPSTRLRLAHTLTLFAVFCLAVPSGGGLAALEIPGVDVRWGNFYTFNEYEDQGSEGVPIDVYVGTALPLSFQALPLETAVAVDFAYREYLVTTEGLVVPTQIETGADAGVGVGGALWILISAPTGLQLRPTTELSLSAGVSPTIFLRLPVKQIEGDTSGMRPYFLDSGRFIFPEVYLSALYDFSQSWSFGITARWLIPAFHLTTEAPLPYPDQMMVGANLSIRRRFGNGEREDE